MYLCFEKRICFLQSGSVFQNTNCSRLKHKCIPQNTNFKKQICFFGCRADLLFYVANLCYFHKTQICFSKFVFCWLNLTVANLCFVKFAFWKPLQNPEKTNLPFKKQICVSKRQIRWKSIKSVFCQICLLES